MLAGNAEGVFNLLLYNIKLSTPPALLCTLVTWDIGDSMAKTLVDCLRELPRFFVVARNDFLP